MATEGLLGVTFTSFGAESSCLPPFARSGSRPYFPLSSDVALRLISLTALLFISHMLKHNLTQTISNLYQVDLTDRRPILERQTPGQRN